MRKILPWAIILALLAAALGHAGVSVAQNRAPASVDRSLVPYSDARQSVRLPDGREIHLVCMGKGSPTVILTAGAGDWSLTWSKVQPDIARTTKVCAWDRAGFGLSTVPRKVQSIVDTTDDLETALKKAGIAGPFVLVGHSLGGLESLLFADRNPDSVVGMVLLDPSVPNQSKRLAAAAPAEAEYMKNPQDSLTKLLRSCAKALRDGTLKKGDPDPNGCLRSPTPPFYPPELIAALKERVDKASEDYIARAMDNMIGFSSMAALARNSKLAINSGRNFGDMPLIVMTRTVFQSPQDFPLAAIEQHPRAEAEWNKAHDELAALSSRGINARVPGASHYIHGDKPQVAIDAILQVVREARGAK